MLEPGQLQQVSTLRWSSSFLGLASVLATELVDGFGDFTQLWDIVLENIIIVGVCQQGVFEFYIDVEVLQHL